MEVQPSCQTLLSFHSAGPERRAEDGGSDIGEHGREHDERPGLQAVDGLLARVLEAAAVEQDGPAEHAGDGQGEAQAQQPVDHLAKEGKGTGLGKDGKFAGVLSTMGLPH